MSLYVTAMSSSVSPVACLVVVARVTGISVSHTMYRGVSYNLSGCPCGPVTTTICASMPFDTCTYFSAIRCLSLYRKLMFCIYTER